MDTILNNIKKELEMYNNITEYDLVEKRLNKILQSYISDLNMIGNYYIIKELK